MRWRRAYQTSSILALNTVLAFVAVNMSVWAGFAVADAVSPSVNRVQAKYGVEALATVYPGWSDRDIRQLLDETWRLQRGFQPYVQFREVPFTGRFVNVHEGGFRHSEDQSPWPVAGTAFNIFFFGGSTTFSYGLPDAETVPSQVQRLLRERGHRQVAMYNFGAGSYQSTQERIYFQELLSRGIRPQMAIFLDGLNEFAFPHVPQDTDVLQRILGDRAAIRRYLVSSLIDDIPLVRLARALPTASSTRPPVPGATADDAGSRAIVESVLARYVSNVSQIAAVARGAGVTPVFVWQPTPFFKYDTRHHPFFEPGGVNRHAAAGYALLRDLIDEQKMAPTFLWAADIQEGVAEPLYVDSVHYTKVMAGRLAAWIVDRILETGLMPATR